MEGIELIAFQIIGNVGMAKTKFIEALAQAKNGDFSSAASLMKEGSDLLVEGHKIHGELIKNERGTDFLVPLFSLNQMVPISYAIVFNQ